MTDDTDVESDSEPAVEPYTAVIYFHGMGSQRRFEETSRFIDSIDTFLGHAHREGQSLGYLTKIRPRIEPARDAADKTFTYIRTFFRASTKDTWALAQNVRFYEVYWAPVMAGQRSPWRVLKWIFLQTFRPWRTLRSPWRERQRLRRASLIALRESGAIPAGVEARDFQTLIERYDAFEGPRAHQDYPKGLFSDFLDFLARKSAKNPVTAERHARLAHAWLRAYRMDELRNALGLASAALAMVLLLGGTLTLVLALLQRFTDFAAGTRLANLAAAAPPTWTTALSFGVALSSLAGLGKFLTDYMGDVEAWATYEETDEKHERRQKVIERGVQTFAHVLGDRRCNRVAVVAHSLGTSIAHDTLLTVARLNRANNAQDPISGPVPLNKVEHFITMGSPIDKIEYFFESYRSGSHRYKRVVEELRGDIGNVPFCRNRKPHIHWVNFWDDADLVSGPLHSPTGRSGISQRVDNVHVASLAFPGPGASHSAYFDNRDVISTIFRMIYNRANSFCALPKREGEDKDWESVYLAPIDAQGKRRVWQILAGSVPWFALGALAAGVAKPGWGLWTWLPGALILLVLAGGFFFSLGKGSLRPL